MFALDYLSLEIEKYFENKKYPVCSLAQCAPLWRRVGEHCVTVSHRFLCCPSHFSLGPPLCLIAAPFTLQQLSVPQMWVSRLRFPKKSQYDQIMTSCHIQTCWEFHPGERCSNNSGCEKWVKLCSATVCPNVTLVPKFLFLYSHA